MRLKKFQMGGQAPEAMPEQPAPDMQNQGEEDAAMQQIAQMAGEIIQQLGPEAAMMLAEAIMEMVQGAQQQAPVFAKGGKLKAKGSCKMAKKK